MPHTLRRLEMLQQSKVEVVWRFQHRGMPDTVQHESFCAGDPCRELRRVGRKEIRAGGDEQRRDRDSSESLPRKTGESADGLSAVLEDAYLPSVENVLADVREMG
jgi:hypothetical protein